MTTYYTELPELTRVLSDVLRELEVPPSKYEEARQHYEAVGNWLNEGVELAPFKPSIYPQGSFALGLAVKPLGEDDYDVDAVCLLQIAPAATTQQRLKEMVGDRLRAHARYARMLDPPEGGRRCWTLRYADESRFHLDVLPAVPDPLFRNYFPTVPESISKHSICITDRETWDRSLVWPRSNPRGYLEWFKERMRIRPRGGQRGAFLAGERAEVQALPVYQRVTPLQRLIQLLKRHRDLRYNGHEHKPISIIITTLAAQAYDHEDDLGAALLNVVPRMKDGILLRDGKWWVPNPVNPAENFADKWNETPEKRTVFLDWLDAVEREHRALVVHLATRSYEGIGEVLTEAYDFAGATTALSRYARFTDADTLEIRRRVTGALTFRVGHVQPPQWPMLPTYSVHVTGRATRNGFRTRTFHFKGNHRGIRRGTSIRFMAETTVPPPYEVRWQVVNTGTEAAVASDLRGDFYDGRWDAHPLVHVETAKYRGRHWVECFIIKDGCCRARSGEFVVNVE